MNNCGIRTLMFNFTQFGHITNLDLMNNYIESVSDDSFKGLTKLRSLMLCYNSIRTLDENAFADLESLMYLDLNENELRDLPKNVFRRLINLTNISIANNDISHIPKNLFGSNRNMTIVNMHNNKRLSQLPHLLFANFPKLIKVDVSNCNLTYLPKNLFENSTKLQTIYLNHNKLFKLTGLFDNLRLEKLDLSHNEFDLSEATKLCELADSLTYLNLSYNVIDEFFYCSSNIKQLNKFDLSSNGITYVKITQYFLSIIDKVHVYLEDNQITTVDLPSDVEYVGKQLILYLKRNPIICNCRNYQLCLYIDNKSNAIEIRAPALEGNNLEYSKATKCPKVCTCNYFCRNKEYIVDCSNQSLAFYPDLLNVFDEFEYDSSVVKLNANSLTEGPPRMKGYENVSQLDLAHNVIDQLDWIPDSLKMLNLVHNNMTSMDTNIITRMDGINVSLHDNPWNCVCDMSSFIKFVKERNMENKDKITCVQNNSLVILIEISDICSPDSNNYYMTFLLVILPITFIVLVIYIKYKKIIRIGMHREECISDINLNYELTYDAFISYSHEDENFVLKELVPKLENISNPYKLCIHQRDWLAGDWIVEQVTRSVEDSRKTIIVLSPSFLDSNWGILEFNLAYSLALKEGSNRIIVILYKEIDMNSNIDKAILEYLQKKTYIKWGEEWFWDILEHALSRN